MLDELKERFRDETVKRFLDSYDVMLDREDIQVEFKEEKTFSAILSL